MESSKKYDNGKIYKLWSLQTNEIYVGSTVQPLHKRLYEHRSRARKTPCERSIYQEMNSLGMDSFNIELIEDYPCKSLNELHRREGHGIRELHATLNTFVVEPVRNTEKKTKTKYTHIINLGRSLIQRNSKNIENSTMN